MSERHLPMQFRVYPDNTAEHQERPRVPVNQILIDDTETTTDHNQRLLFGSGKLQTVRENDDGTITRFTVREVLYYADDLPKVRPATYAALQEYAATHKAGIDDYYPTYGDQEHGQLDIEPHDDIDLLPHSEYVRNYLLKSAWSTVQGRVYQPATIVGFNLSFDMWRHMSGVSEARGFFYGGLSGEFLNGEPWTPEYREIKAGIGMKRGMTGKKEGAHTDPSYLVDVAELVRALTGKPHSLLSAGKAFGCRVLKYDGQEVHDPEARSGLTGDALRQLLLHYIGYNRNDVDATGELWQKAMERFLKHPIQLRPDLTYSPASISKQYLRDMGVHAPMCACKDCVRRHRGGHRVPLEVQGRCATAFYGGRAECRVRLESTPCVLNDFTSMYPTVMCLLGIWDMLTAEAVECREETVDVRELLTRITAGDLYRPETWTLLRGVADIQADGDLLPVRSPYQDSNGSTPGIGVNQVTADRPVTWTLLDLAASKILTGKVPEIVTAWRFYPSEARQSTLVPIRFNGDECLTFDPACDDLLKFLVEQRQIAKARHKANRHLSASRLVADDKPSVADALRAGITALHDAGMKGFGDVPLDQVLDDRGLLERPEDCKCAAHRELRKQYFFKDKAGEPFGTFMRSPEGQRRIELAERQASDAHAHDNQAELWNADRGKCLCEACETEGFLKVDGNSVYGVFAEMNRRHMADSGHAARDAKRDAAYKEKHPDRDLKGMAAPVTVYGLGGDSWPVPNPEMPGEYCFMPFACMITGGARLMLALVEKAVRDYGAPVIFMDTDSACIPATKSGKLSGAIPVLSYKQVDAIRECFNSLNPYDRSIVPELLKWEKPERDSVEYPSRPLYCTVISAKRYALYYRDKITFPDSGEPRRVEIIDSDADRASPDDPDSMFSVVDIEKRSEHGLGLYSNPSVRDASDMKDVQSGDWYKEAWYYIVATNALGLEADEPVWFDRPAVSVFPVRSQHIWKAFREYNRGKPYYGQVIPYNFYLAFHPARTETMWPDQRDMRLIAPFERDPRKWPNLAVIDMHDGQQYQVTTDIDRAVPGRVILVKSYQQVISDYVSHPETKYDAANGEPCSSDTRGILRPCHINALAYQHITKDSSSVTTAGEAHAHLGPHVYTDDITIRVLGWAKEVFRSRKLSRRKLAAATNTTEDQARGFLSDNASRYRTQAEIAYVMHAVRLARTDLDKVFHCRYGSDSPSQLLSRWVQWRRWEANRNDETSA
jgi:hypothetical protein